MEFRISDTFSDSLVRLTSQEQKSVKITALDLQLNPAHPSLSFHRIDKARDPNFWSVRVSRDIRIIIHKTEASLLLCYVDHHDAAYDWAIRRKIERHPRTGAAQLIEIRERVQEIPIFKHVEVAREAQREDLFNHVSDDALLGYGVPAEWIADVRAADEDSLFDLVEHLPQESAEALLELAIGNTPPMPEPAAPDVDPFDHPDAQRRFRIFTNQEELEQALDYPWEKWTVFLHPAQRHLVERDYNGPARVAGSAGTGKTVVALHRTVHLARQHPNATILLATFSDALANALNVKLLRLIGYDASVKDRILIHSMKELGSDLYTAAFGAPQLVEEDELTQLLVDSAERAQVTRFTPQFLLDEWHNVVDAWQLESWEAYRDVPRLGRRTRIGGRQREALWAIFVHLRTALVQRGRLTWPALFHQVTAHYANRPLPFDFAVVDEAQDLSVPELRFLAVFGRERSDSLFFAGDLGQRIFQQPFSWKGLGVDVRGRSFTLQINYRTSHQIRRQADRLLPDSLADVDGNRESRSGTVSVFNGPRPTIELLDSAEDEAEFVGAWLKERLDDGISADEIGVFVRSDAELVRAERAVELSGVKGRVLDEWIRPTSGSIAISTMHLAKGLEFRTVVVMACDDEVLPLQSRIEQVTDESDLQEVYDTERHLLYVACTRAREYLLVSGVDPASEFLDDMNS